MRRKYHYKQYDVKILDFLISEDRKPFGEIQKMLKTRSPGAVSYALRNLQLRGHVIRNIDRKYQITEMGRFARGIGQISRELELGAMSAYKEESITVSSTAAVEPFLEQRNKIPFDIGLIGDANLDFQKTLDKIRFELSYLPSRLLHQFAEEVGREKGLKRPTIDSFSPCFDNLRWIKDAYDFEITFMMHFDPRRLMKSIDWSEIFAKCRDLDKKFVQGLQTAKRLIEKNREKSLDNHVIQELRYASTSNPIEDWLRSENTPIGRSEKDVLNRLISEIEKQLTSTDIVASKGEIATILRKNLKERYRIVKTTIYSVEKIA